MSKLIADILRKPDGGLRRRYYCENEGGLNRAVSHTLLMLIAESSSPTDVELEALIIEAQAGSYHPLDPGLPDWSVNDKNVWLVPPMATAGHVCVSNDYIDEYSSDEEGGPQQFTFDQVLAALRNWRNFTELVRREGVDVWIGRRYEVEFPER